MELPIKKISQRWGVVKKSLIMVMMVVLFLCVQKGFAEETSTAPVVVETEKTGVVDTEKAGVVDSEQDYTVKVGDTLWDISKRFYKDPFLWPRLWQQNQYITNPHQIKPGDLIRLYPYKVLIQPQPQEGKAPIVEEARPLAPPKLTEAPPALPSLPNIIRLTVYPEVNSAGFIADKMEGVGRIVAAKVDRLQLVAEDVIYIAFQRGFTAKKGDTFTIYRVGEPIVHPIIKKKILGRKIMILGTAVITQAKEGEAATALITRSYDTMIRGDEVTPYFAPIEGLPVGTLDKPVYGWIVATQLPKLEFVEGDVVYIDCGENDQLKPGHVFNVLRRGALVPDPRYKEKKKKGAFIKLPDEIIARLVVLKTQPLTATAVIVQTKLSVQIGDEVTSVPE
jgi:LysM repeat protein